MPMTSFSHYPFTHLGMDVHRDSISVAVLPPEAETAECDKLFNDEDSVRRLVARLGDPGRLRACYEAGPTGYGLHRQLTTLGVRCDVVAPALIPKAAGDRVKTDKRDARRLARLHRMGELVAIRVPTEAEEGVRDLLGPVRTWSSTGAGPASASRRSSCATGRSIAAGTPGRCATSSGSPRDASPTGRCRPPMTATGRW